MCLIFRVLHLGILWHFMAFYRHLENFKEKQLENLNKQGLSVYRKQALLYSSLYNCPQRS